MSEWQPIETAPKDGSHILVGGPWMPVCEVSWHKATDWDYPGWRCGRFGAKGYDDLGAYEPTHWMPLPEPPK